MKFEIRTDSASFEFETPFYMSGDTPALRFLARKILKGVGEEPNPEWIEGGTGMSIRTDEEWEKQQRETQRQSDDFCLARAEKIKAQRVNE